MAADGKTDTMPGRPQEFRFRRFVVRVIEGPDKGAEQPSTRPHFSVGAASSNDLVLSDATVSRNHFVLEVEPAGVLLRDLGSTNGTRVGGTRVQAAYLEAGAIVSLGNTRLRFDVLADEVREPLSELEHLEGCTGRSVAMRRIFAMLPRIATSDATVLIEGETGTGKGVIAEAIHALSGRSAAPLVVIDCASIPPSLIESELFGHVKGAFTGAAASRAGAFEAAAGGTVFLDEIGELPVEMQPKLLRVLEERTIRRVGSVDPVKLSVRVIAATNRDLRQAVNRGSFRADLYYRLNIVRLEIPPLRERREDIPLLVEEFYRQFTGQPEASAPRELVERMMGHEWRGNVRELRNLVERALLMQDLELWQELHSGRDEASGEEVAFQFDESLSFRTAKQRVVGPWERWYVHELLRRHAGNVSHAARAARMDRSYLGQLIKRYFGPGGG